MTRCSQTQWESLRGHPVAIVFQDPLSFLNPVMRIGRQIAESIRRHTPDMPVEARVGELLDLVKLPQAIARAYPHELSGGMRQRALLAIALACGPRLLIADEPTTALDVTTQAEILALLRELREKLGMAMLLISHDLGIVASACERLYVMYAGRMVEWGRTRDVFGKPAHPYTVGLFQAARAARDAQGRFATIRGDPPHLAELAQGCPFAPRCAQAMAECARSMPEPSALAEGTSHAVRCWLYPKEGLGETGVDRCRGRLHDGAAPRASRHHPSFRRSGGSLVQAVRAASLEVGHGETVALVGESGSGKSTLGRIALSLLAPDEGRVLLDGKPFSEMSSRDLRRERIALQPIFQDATASLNPRRPVRELLAQALRQRRAGAIEAQSVDLLDSVGLRPGREYLSATRMN